MSQKSGKKLRKRADDEETSANLSTSTNETNSKIHEEDSVGNGVEEEEGKANKQENMGEVEVNGTYTDESKISVEHDHNVQQEIIIKEVIIQKEVNDEKIEQNETVEDESCKVTMSTVENQEISENDQENNQEKQAKIEKSEKIDENQTAKVERTDPKVDGENELEPLVLESEEVDPELEFDETSDVDSQKSSPIIRCRTRRSQTRNIPTPKTPKTFDINNEDKVSECSEKPSVLTVHTPEVTDTESEMSVFKPVTDVYDTNEKRNTPDEDFDSFQNVSTKAVAGSDTTRNVDLMSYPEDDFEFSPFLNQSREQTVGETLKLLTSRRSIRTAKTYTLPVNSKKDYNTPPLLPKRNSIERVSGTKRKHQNDTSDYTKRFKSESPGLLSYISSPIMNLKNRFTKSEIPSSTPKLTGYKTKNMFDNTNVSKITLNETDEVVEKKWCTIM